MGSRDTFRRPWRRESASTSVDLPPLEPGLAPEDADVIWTAIRALPSGQRKVIVLRHIWDRSVEETAADLGIRPGTVKTQTRDALAARADLVDMEGWAIAVACLLRLVVSPLAVMLFCGLFGVEGITASVAVLFAALPGASTAA